MDEQITIKYVNPRNGNRPPSLKGDNGEYYTLSDAAYQSMGPWKGHSGMISFTVNQKGFKIATHWNGAALPKNDPQGNYHEAAQPAKPQGGPPPPAPTPAPPDKLPYGYLPLDADGIRTLPSVREQAIIKAWVARIEWAGDQFSFAWAQATLAMIRDAWDAEMSDDGKAEQDDPPPPVGEDDYGWRQ